MSLRLFQFHPDALSAKTRKILEFKGCEYEALEVDYLNRGEVLEVSGALELPVAVMEDGTVVGREQLAAELESRYPEPTILPPATRGLQVALERYLHSDVHRAIFSVAAPEMARYYASQGEDRRAFFVARHPEAAADFQSGALSEEREYRRRTEQMEQLLMPFEEALANRAFLLGRLGLADFALYGELWMLGFSGELKLAPGFAALWEFFSRLDNVSADLAIANQT